jgi:hypothetical protein
VGSAPKLKYTQNMGAYQGGFLTNLLEFQQFQTKFKLFYDTITMSFCEGFFNMLYLGRILAVFALSLLLSP